jgi:DNA helicase-2/ATP-dependent DNA helicase PcrA
MDEADQCDAVCRSVLEHRERGTPLRNQAVLFRAAHHSDLLEVELSRRNIPFVKYGGMKFLESAHVKDALAMLRILENPHEEVSWYRVLQLLDGVGPAAARRLMAGLGVGRIEGTAGSPLRVLDEGVPQDAPEPAIAGLMELRSALADCSGQPSPLPAAAQLERIRRFLGSVFERRYSSPASRIRDLEQLELLASRSASRRAFLSDLTLDPPASTGDLAGPPLLDEDYLILSTIHSAKGCEWDVVHVIHAADGMIPSDMATGDAETIEEERRLFYVALTRARAHLFVYAPLRYYRRPRGLGDPHAYAQVTRFLPEPVMSLFERRSTGAESAVGALAGGMARVEGFLADLWE